MSVIYSDEQNLSCQSFWEGRRIPIGAMLLDSQSEFFWVQRESGKCIKVLLVAAYDEADCLVLELVWQAHLRFPLELATPITFGLLRGIRPVPPEKI